MRLADIAPAMSFCIRSVCCAALFSLLTPGCVGDLVELSGRDQGVSSPDLAGPTPDMGGGGGDGGGGGPSFANDINPDLVTGAFGCSAASCHGTTQVPLLKDGAGEVTNNYTSFKTRATLGEMSLVLTKLLPIAEGGIAHSGGNSYFTNKQDAKYVKWLSWVNGGQLP